MLDYELEFNAVTIAIELLEEALRETDDEKRQVLVGKLMQHLVATQAALKTKLEAERLADP